VIHVAVRDKEDDGAKRSARDFPDESDDIFELPLLCPGIDHDKLASGIDQAQVGTGAVRLSKKGIDTHSLCPGQGLPPVGKKGWCRSHKEIMGKCVFIGKNDTDFPSGYRQRDGEGKNNVIMGVPILLW
jgi:hypothetical protein